MGEQKELLTRSALPLKAAEVIRVVAANAYTVLTVCEALLRGMLDRLELFNLGSRRMCSTEAFYRCWVLLLIWYLDSILIYKICFIIASFIDSAYGASTISH